MALMIRGPRYAPVGVFFSMSASGHNPTHLGRASAVLFLLLLSLPAWPQVVVPKAPVPEAQAEIPKDTLGRNTPRGAVLGFLSAARKGNAEIAVLYLNTPLRGEEAEDLARQLAIVLDRRLPARLNSLSDKPEGSIPDPLRPDEDLVGTIPTANGDLDILIERVDRGKLGKIWLFSRKTLKTIPDVFPELTMSTVEKILPESLVKNRLAGIPIFEWLALFVGMPCLYALTGLVDRLLGLVVSGFRRHLLRNTNQQNSRMLPPPLRLLLLALTIRWLLSTVGLPLLARQFWSTMALIISIAACVWLLILVNGWGERYLVERRPGLSGSAAVLRLIRRVIDGVILFTGLLFTLYHFGINPTAALTGLGVGGIAVALAAQKTLENVIAGISLIADQVVHVGDALKVGDIVGTVEEVGLRSTRIRTNDRTLVCVPNGQIANMSLENFTARDRFWFHPMVGLRYETTPLQMRSLTAEVHKLLTTHPSFDASSVRVRFIRLGPSSLDVEIFSYLYARDWNHFLEIQEDMLLRVMEITQEAGAEIAFPSQTTYLAAHPSDRLSLKVHDGGGRRHTDRTHIEETIHH
jgi:MscS family membrane protein